MMEAELFDGTVLEFPDGTAPEVIQRVVKEQTAAKRGTTTAPAPVVEAAAVAPPAEPSFVDTIMNGLGYADDTGANALRGLREGVANLTGLPVDAVNNIPRLANLIPGVDGVGPISDYPVGGSDFIDDALGGFGLVPEPPAPDGLVQRGARRVGQEVGAAAIPAVGALATAARVGVAGARAMPGIARMFVEPAAVNPGAYLGKETAMALGAGGGAAAANELVDPNSRFGPTADLLGAVSGAGLTGLGTMVGRGVMDLGAAALGNPGFASSVVRDSVADTLIRNSDTMGRQVDPENLTAPLDTQSLVDAIRRPADAEGLIPGFRASTADRAGDAGLALLENARARSTPGPYRSRTDANAMAVEETMQGYAPTETPGAFRSALETERGVRLNNAAVARQTAEQQALAAITGIQPTTTPAQRGSTVRSALEDARDVARARTEDAYQTADVANNQVDPAPLAQSLDERLAGLTEVERGLVPQGTIERVRALGAPLEAAPQPTGILDASGNPITREAAGPEPVRLKEATDLKSELQRLQRAAVADPRAEKGGRNAARVLGQMIDTVDGFIAQNVTPEQQVALDTARGTKFDEVEAFGRQGDPVADALARREGGVPKVRDDMVAGKFVNPQAMDRLFTEADTPAVRAAIRDEVLSRGDTSSAERINAFTQQYGEQLGRFPGLRAELDNAARARTGETTARESETALQRDLGTDTQPGRGSIGRYLQYSDDNAEKAVSEVLAAKDPGRAADELASFSNDPTAIEGFKAAFWKKLESNGRAKNANAETDSGIMPFVPKKMLAFLDDPKVNAVAERLYRDNPEHLADIRKLAEALRGVNSGARVGNAANPSGTAMMQKGQGAVSMAEIGSKIYQAKIGRISPIYIGTYLAGKIARVAVGSQRAKAFELLLDKAMLDPEIAASLLTDNNPANRAAMARKAKGWMGNEASTLVNLMNEDDDKQDPTAKAISGGR